MELIRIANALINPERCRIKCFVSTLAIHRRAHRARVFAKTINGEVTLRTITHCMNNVIQTLNQTTDIIPEDESQLFCIGKEPVDPILERPILTTTRRIARMRSSSFKRRHTMAHAGEILGLHNGKRDFHLADQLAALAGLHNQLVVTQFSRDDFIAFGIDIVNRVIGTKLKGLAVIAAACPLLESNLRDARRNGLASVEVPLTFKIGSRVIASRYVFPGNRNR